MNTYCKQYNDYYGNSHKEYGGILTDLRTLAYGSYFHCCNGNWDGCIVEENSKKYVIVLISQYDIPEIEITDENCALYIK